MDISPSLLWNWFKFKKQEEFSKGGRRFLKLKKLGGDEGVRTKFESTTLSLSFYDNKMQRYINCMIHVRHICCLKNYILFYRNSDGYQQENIIISINIRRWDININIRRCYIRCQNQKINLCLRWSLMNISARN